MTFLKSSKKSDQSLSDRFIEGLKKYNITYDEIINSGWKYIGGDSGADLRYFKLCCKGREMPKHEDYCVCGHAIKNNCYINHGEQILILGNCCVKKFIPQSSRTCESCNKTHKNRIINKFNDCRKGFCDICGIRVNEKYKKCFTCTFN